MAAAPPGRRSSSPKKKSKPYPVHLVEEDQISITNTMANRLKPLGALVGILIALITFIGIVWSGWRWAGGSSLVTDHALHETITAVKTDLGKKIDVTKTEVIDLGAKGTDEVKTDIKGVKSQIETLGRQAATTSANVLEYQQRTLWMQRSSQQAQLGSIVAQLHDKPTDQMLLQRKSEVEGVIAYIERETALVQEQLRRIRSGQP